ncbi:hypothetical protein DAMNIGENAA_26240 [Desulforhabdus amnigena]|uniref:Uncharacterized protein n=1 Tax=Desulforhabdus amnigena TaxID=40218 RepID=A0A9W6L9L1_9BACT|nr:hypothetical protein DAMNIGENAA_26240 [Desulforhabdus amnigena]
MEKIGEVRTCAHCYGTGKCNCPSCTGNALSSKSVICSACGGKGSVWIGPEKIYIKSDK